MPADGSGANRDPNSSGGNRSLRSPFVWVRMILWVVAILAAMMPFVKYETIGFSTFDVSIWEVVYIRHYRAVLIYFVLALAYCMFDMVQLTFYTLKVQSLLAIFYTAIGGILILLFIIFFGALSDNLTGSLTTIHWSLFSLAGLTCALATGLVAMMLDEYRTRAELSVNFSSAGR